MDSNYTPQPTAKCVAILIAGVVILALFPLWIKLFEKQWRWDLLTRQAILSGPDIITGGSFGPEASIVALTLGTILSAFYLCKILKSQHL